MYVWPGEVKLFTSALGMPTPACRDYVWLAEHGTRYTPQEMVAGASVVVF